ncbi:MAG: DUF1553 domain-containing protein [Rubripirellula sp.]
MRRCSLAWIPFALLSVAWCRADTVEFARDIRPILSDKCFYCHGPDEQHREADLRLDLQEEAFSVIEPGQPDASELVARILSRDDDIMPPVDSHKVLSDSEIELLSRWVTQGAEWTQHWSFNHPDKGSPAATRTRDAIDSQVLKKMPATSFSPEASREKLIRRVTYDLTGMPPTLAELDAFLADSSTDAYERLVDRLLRSPRYGQRMGLAWMDAARYGDTSVYHADGPRSMWAWRDAIVDAYTRNMPFDEFSTSQIAGDLLPEATLEQKLLAGFNRNNGTTDEGGAIAEEYRVEYAVDRVKTTSTVWLGLTMECAQCHDHKYDPISQEDYYRFYAFFNISSDGGMQTRKGNAEPTLAIPDPAKQAKLPDAELRLATATERITEIESSCQAELDNWIALKQQDPESVDEAPSDFAIKLAFSEEEGKKTEVQGPKSKPDEVLTATIHGKPIWIEARSDSGIKLDGSNYVDVGDFANFERTDAFSYGGWVKPPKKSGVGALIGRMDDANAHRGFDLYVGDGPVSVHLINSWPGNAIKVTTKKRLTPDQWHHVFAVYDGSSKAKGIQIFVDGELWDWKIEQNGLSETMKTEKTLLIGSRHSGSRLKGEIDEIQIYDRKLSSEEVQQLAEATPISSLLAIQNDARTETQTQVLRRFFLNQENPEYAKLTKQVAATETELTELRKPLTTVMVMSDMSSPRETFVLNRGAYDSPTDVKVEPGTPTILPPMGHDMPRNRLGLSRWLFSDEHPLTARVAINRYWQMLFGHGLVATPEDFGAQGQFPSHPQLLDWLAVDFRESGWDVKRMLKEIVLSKTYRQSSASSPEQYQADPFNQWLSRGPRFRLQGEFIRDSALQLSGLLRDQMGGPGVRPYQPAGLWAEVGLGGNPKFVQDHGDSLYRRSLYTYWKRSAPPPSMQIFDAPTREKCTIRRARTNTPLQALVTLNDTQFVEAARHFAERMIREGGRTDEERLSFGFRLAVSRAPEANELSVLKNILSHSLDKYGNDSDAANALLAVGESPRDEALSTAHHAAWTIVASAILNLDETLTRE